MALIQPVPTGSIYVWCYAQGLHGVSWEELLSAIAPYGITPRDGINHPDNKDYRNWSDGMRRYLGQDFIYEPRGLSISLMQDVISTDPRAIEDLSSYPLLDCDSTEYERTRWVPCNERNKPLVAWSKTRFSLEQARLWPGCKFLAENLKGCRWVVLDFDIDHDKDNLDWELRDFGLQMLKDFPTQALYKPDWMGFHLTYWTDREIKTRHLPHVNMDICGNTTETSGQLRYFKSKKANDVPQTGLLTEEIWSRLQQYSLTRDVIRKVKNNELINRDRPEATSCI